MKLVWMAWLMACLVVPLGAYVRLSQAGLGCPDWPGCFGQLSPRHAAVAIAQAEQRAPDGPVSSGKAWREMIHRYLAGTLGAILLLLALQSWRKQRQRLAFSLLLAGVLLQGLLGMLTVTWRLFPAMVSAHLVLGMTLAAGLAALVWRARLHERPAPLGLRVLSRTLLALILAQIALGGWVSSNHAALACAGFPSCNGGWLPPTPFAEAFPWHGAPEGLALATIQWSHRLGALLVTTLVFLLLGYGWRETGLRPSLVGLGLAWALQVGLGVANVLLGLPLTLAVAHNLGALVLLSVTMVMTVRMREKIA